MGKLISVIHEKRILVARILLTCLYFVASISVFYGVRIMFLILSNYGLNSISVIPAFITLCYPLFLLFMLILFIHVTTIKAKRRTLLVTGLTYLVCGLFGIILSIILMSVIYDGKVVVGNITKLFPLDILLWNIVVFLVGICCLIFLSIDKKNNIITVTSDKKFKPLRFVLLGFYLPFAAYFFGECLFGFTYIFEGYISPKWYGVLPIYMLYLAMTIGLVLYCINIHYKGKNKTKLQIISTISLVLYVAIFLVWYLVAYNLDPYLIAQGLTWEFEILISIKKPIGYLAIPAWIFILAIYYTVKMIVLKKTHKYEQEQETLQQDE